MTPRPTDIRLKRAERVLEVAFDSGETFRLPAEYLRVNSPSAEVQGHGPGRAVPVVGKAHVGIRGLRPVGQYAIQLEFDDGHDSGLYSWATLYELGRDQASRWSDYLRQLEAAGLVR